MVELNGVSYASGGCRILEGISTSFLENRFNVILGPNGAGKSTLLRIATGLLAPTTGVVCYDGQRLTDFLEDALARRRAVLSQHVELAFPLSVEDVVLMGRYPHYAHKPSHRDLEIVGEAIKLVGLDAKRSQIYPTLSGGERQKTHLARVLAQIWHSESSDESRYLFLDEPTTGLDIHYEIHLLDVARNILGQNCTVIAVMHDLNSAVRYADAFFFLDGGRLVSRLTDKHDIRQDLIESVFSVSANKITDAGTNETFWRFGL